MNGVLISDPNMGTLLRKLMATGKKPLNKAKKP